MAHVEHDPQTEPGLGDRATPESASLDLDAQPLEDLLGTVSHDLKSPLSAIVMTAATLGRIEADERTTPQIRRKAETIQRCAERMTKVIDELLDLVSLQGGRFAIETGAEEPTELVAEAMKKARAGADERGVTLRSTVADGMPRVSCDRERIVQVLASLLENAIGVSDGSEVSIGASRAPDEIVFFVQDGGPRIAPDEFTHVFARGRRTRGAALWLNVAKGIVAAHGGRIWIECGSEIGNRFSFAIPVATNLEPRSMV